MSMNMLFVGRLGSASKTITFEEKDFKKELAPPNAKFEHLELNSKKFIRMTYKL